MASPDPFSPDQIARVSRRIKLASGRYLGIAEYGPRDGPVILYFHGWPSCRLEPAILDIDSARIVAVDRPGYGLSDPVPGKRRLADWPDDIGALADHLGLARFALFGMSGGAPYAAAVANAMPERVVALALVSGLGPPEAPGMLEGRMAMLRGFGTAPIRRRVVFNLARHILRSEKNDARILAARKAHVRRGGRDIEAFTESFGKRLLACWREGLRQGIEGAASDAHIYGEAWPFTVRELKVPTTIWHGTADPIVPVAVGRFYAETVPGAQAHIVPEEGHVSLVANHHPAIIEGLVRAFQDASERA